MVENDNSSDLSDVKVGILFNSPVMPSKGENIDYVADAEVEEEVVAVEEALGKLGLEYRRLPLKDNAEEFIEALKVYGPDVAINLCEAVFGDSHLEMDVPAILELLKVPYTGSSPLALGLCQNKCLAKDVLRARGIPTPRYQVLDSPDDWSGKIGYPLFVKPLSEDGSIGITKESFVTDEETLRKRVEYIINCYRQEALVEQYIDGREFNVAILGNSEIRILPISEIVFGFSHGPKIVDYPAKWLKESEEYKKTMPFCPAELRSSTRSLVERAASQAYEALHCRDYARVDIRLRGRIPYVLEANPNPDISFDGGFARSLRAARISYEDFLKEIICSALKRGFVASS